MLQKERAMKKLIYGMIFSCLIFSLYAARHDKKNDHAVSVNRHHESEQESLFVNPRRYPRKYNLKYNPDKFEQQDDFGYYPVCTKHKKSYTL